MDTSRQFVTQRNRKRNKSYETLPDVDLNSTFLSTQSDQANSLPDLSTLHSEQMNDLSEQVASLKIELESAHEEINKLLTENSILQKKNTDLEIKNSNLINICSSSGKKRKQNLNISRTPMNLKKINLNDSLNETTNKAMVGDKFTQTTPQKKEKSILCTEEMHHSTNTERRKIWIFGSQQCVGLASELIQSRDSTPHVNYEVEAQTKPNANSEEILKGIQNAKFKEDDKIVLSLGENDCNPIMILSVLCTILMQFRDMNIFVLSAIHSNFLNEPKLNSEIKRVCSNFPKSHFIEYDKLNRMSMSKTMLLKYQCKIINFKIDCTDYNEKFITKDNKKTVNGKNKKTLNKSEIQTNQKKDKSLKGTIPYYFKQISKGQTNKVIPPRTSNTQGKVPYYYCFSAGKSVNKRTFADTTATQRKDNLFRS